jgi:hypothetical protein
VNRTDKSKLSGQGFEMRNIALNQRFTGMQFANLSLMVNTAKRFPLDSTDGLVGKICYTLVVKERSNFYVERYTDSPLPFVNGRLKILMFADCGRVNVNGVPLINLVINRLRHLSF